MRSHATVRILDILFEAEVEIEYCAGCPDNRDAHCDPGWSYVTRIWINGQEGDAHLLDEDQQDDICRQVIDGRMEERLP